jgi:hypothetical protein
MPFRSYQPRHWLKKPLVKGRDLLAKYIFSEGKVFTDESTFSPVLRKTSHSLESVVLVTLAPIPKEESLSDQQQEQSDVRGSDENK